MKIFRADECENWCSGIGIEVVAGVEKPRIVPASPPNCFSIKFPERGTDRISLTIALLNDAPGHAIYFDGGLLWFHRWDIWGENTEQMGKLTMELMRDAFIQPPDLRSHPGMLFQKSELVYLRSFYALGMIYEWDFSFIDHNSQFIILSSHDGVIYIICRTAEYKAALIEKYAPYWEVTGDDCPHYLRGP